jgi:hypothetical protein
MLVQSVPSSVLMSGSEKVNSLSSHVMRVYSLSQGSDMAVGFPLFHCGTWKFMGRLPVRLCMH